jgi:RND family efflux transporter MFP subunit
LQRHTDLTAVQGSPEGEIIEPALDGLDEVAQDSEEVAAEEAAPEAVRYRPGTGRRLAISAAAIVVVLVLAFVAVHMIKGRQFASLKEAAAAHAEQAPTVEVTKVAYAPPTQMLTLPGETRGWYSSLIYARVNGYLAEWLVDIGDRVKKDQVLATIDTPDLDAQLAAAQAQLQAAEADVQVKEAEARFAKATYARWQASPQGVVSDQDREDKKARFDTSNAQLNAARARAALSRADVDRLRYLTRFKQVSAPFDGVIAERRVDIGDLVTAGSTTGTTPLFAVAQYDQIRVFADVPQRVSLNLAVGNAAEITASEHPNRVFAGTIARMSEAIDPHARTMRVEVDLPNADLALRPGMYVQVSFQLKPTKLVQVPASAMLFRVSGPQVAVIDGNQKVKFQDVVIARDNGKMVEIASGLSEGDTVAVNISNQIAGGQTVMVAQNGQPPAAPGR